MTALGGEIVDYAEADVAGIVEWRNRAFGEAYANYAVRYLLGVVAPAADPYSVDVSGLLMTATLPDAVVASECALPDFPQPQLIELPTTSE